MYQKMHPDMDWRDVAKVVAENEGINEVGLNQNQMKVLEALVEAGDLPPNVLGAWDGIEDAEVIDVNEETTGEPDSMEATMRLDAPALTTPETDSVSDMDDN